ncbi:MAG: cytochrome P450 [Pseudomonadales bacterium]|nr:cytochrome P450 [Pseudomonadales bacterium]
MSEAASVLPRDPYSVPLDQIDMSLADLYQQNLHWTYFERLRKEDPVHYCANSPFGPYWSITKFDDILHVDKNHEIFSSEPAITIGDFAEDFETPNFIVMDPPDHDVRRRTVTPGVSPATLADLEPVIRQRAGKILDELPVGETFDWVDKVSIELTTQMLATLFDFPFEDRHLLPYWSDIMMTSEDLAGSAQIDEEERRKIMLDCVAYFERLWKERAAQPPKNDFISLLAHGEHTKNMDRMEFLGTLFLLIVGGNDTTRNSISGGVVALNDNPDQYQKLRDNPGLLPSMVSEIIRYQTPLTHMRRTATQDTVLRGKKISAGDKVVMWYASGNRDEEIIDNPNSFNIERDNARHHLSFGFGVHRCMGNRLAEMQLRTVWEEIMNRFHTVEMVGEPVLVHSNFVKGIAELPVIVHAV